MSAFLAPLKVATRVLSFIGRELVEVGRRPGALASLVFGPFLLLAVFGLGYGGYRRPLAALLVIPPSSGLPSDVGSYRDIAPPGLDVVGVLPDLAAATQQLRSQSVDVVAVAPRDAMAELQAGRQAVVQVQIDTANPTQAAYAGVIARSFTSAINREIIRRLVQRLEGQASTQGVDPAYQIPPDVAAQPTTSKVVNIAPVVPSVDRFFAPAVLALILGHMAVTLIALSVIRERTSGVIELFRISPLSAWELVLGKVLGFGALCALVAAVTVGLLVGGLGVPMLGSPAMLAGVIALLVLASLGLGLLISIVSDSERQAVQLSLLVLLATVFFSGFVLPLEEFSPPVRAAAYAIPVTDGLHLIQDVMLRGQLRDPWQLGVLAAIATGLLVACWLLLRRSMQRA